MRKIFYAALLVLSACGGGSGGGGSAPVNPEGTQGTALSGGNDFPGVNFQSPAAWTPAQSQALTRVFSKGESRFVLAYDFSQNETIVTNFLGQNNIVLEGVGLTADGSVEKRKGAQIRAFQGFANGRQLSVVIAGAARPQKQANDLGAISILAVGTSSEKASLLQDVRATVDSISFVTLAENTQAKNLLSNGDWLFEDVFHSGSSTSSGSSSASAREQLVLCGDQYRWKKESFVSVDIPSSGGSNVNQQESFGRYWVYGPTESPILVGRDQSTGTIVVLAITANGANSFKDGSRVFQKSGPGC